MHRPEDFMVQCEQRPARFADDQRMRRFWRRIPAQSGVHVPLGIGKNFVELFFLKLIRNPLGAFFFPKSGRGNLLNFDSAGEDFLEDIAH